MTDQYKGAGIMRHCWGCQRHRMSKGGSVRGGFFRCAECTVKVNEREAKRKEVANV